MPNNIITNTITITVAPGDSAAVGIINMINIIIVICARVPFRTLSNSMNTPYSMRHNLTDNVTMKLHHCPSLPYTTANCAETVQQQSR